MAFSFFGGVHPKENKWYACDKETQVFPEPDIVVIPMSQHIGVSGRWSWPHGASALAGR